MHQARTTQRSGLRWRRLAVALVIAVTLAGTSVVAFDGVWEALCAAYNSGQPEWWLFQCYLLPPSGSPGA